MSKSRINTQIPRRKKASGSESMQSEWDDREGARGTQLKMPADAMVSQKRAPRDAGDAPAA